jgi:ribosomal-protein-alanine N-acetyltransferase
MMFRNDIHIKGRTVAVCSLRLNDAETLGKMVYTDMALHEWGICRSLKNIVPANEFMNDTIGWCQRNHAVSMVILKNDELAIGLISLSHINEEEKSGGIGYWIGSDYWKKGYGTEAFALVLNLAVEMKLTHVWGTVDKRNEASQRIWQKFGGQMQPLNEKNDRYTITLTSESCAWNLLQEYL